MRGFVRLRGVVAIPIYSLHNLFWRLSLILTDGMVDDRQEMNARIPLTFTGLEEWLEATFAGAPELKAIGMSTDRERPASRACGSGIGEPS